MTRIFGMLAAAVLGAALTGGLDAAGMPAARLLTPSGGRVAWYHGQKHDLIAYDAVVDKKSRNTEVYVVNPDGSGKKCVTCGSSIPKGFVGQPEWHPDGEHLILQAESSKSKHGLFNHMSWGIDNDLWIINRDGSGAQRLISSDEGHAVLHPHFSEDGRTLIYSERVPTGEKLRRLIPRMVAPGGENPWDGWRIHVADFDVRTARLSNDRTFAPNGPGFYETHQIENGRILYSHTDQGMPYVANVYEVSADGRGSKNLTGQNGTWNEHGLYSPDGRKLAFISSRFDSKWKYPGSAVKDLRTELYVQEGGGTPQRVTDMNAKGPKVAVSDYDWDRNGSRIVVQVAQLDGKKDPELFVLDIP